MFGLGFTEIIMIAIVALLFIGPEKLPDTMRQIARTLGKIKRAFEDTKSTIQQELNIEELRQEALSYRREIEKAKSDLSAFKNVANKEINDIKESARINTSIYKPADINDDSSLWDELEEAEKQFENMEKSKSELEKNESKSPYVNSDYEKPAEKLKSEEEEADSKEIAKDSETVDFKHLKTKDS